MNEPQEAAKKRKLEEVTGEESDVPTAESNKPAGVCIWPLGVLDCIYEFSGGGAALSSGSELKPDPAPAAPGQNAKLQQLHRSFLAALQPPVSYERYNTAALADKAKRCPSISTMLHLGCGDGLLTSNLVAPHLLDLLSTWIAACQYAPNYVCPVLPLEHCGLSHHRPLER